jgi:uncharacterized membrane protein YdjX (TVP38/TMEM64 family)
VTSSPPPIDALLPADPGSAPRPAWQKLLVAVIVIACSAALVFIFREHVSLADLAEREAELRSACRDQPVLALAIAFALYFTVTSLSVPTIWPLSVAYGWLFGFLPALVVVSFASTAGATVALLISRYVLRDFVERRFGARWRAIERGVERDAISFLLTLRLIPVIPFFLVNLLMGPTRIPLRTYWWVSQVGMLPATCVYVWAGASVPSLNELAKRGAAGLLSWQLAAALTAIGLLPYVGRKAAGLIRPKMTNDQGRK